MLRSFLLCEIKSVCVKIKASERFEAVRLVCKCEGTRIEMAKRGDLIEKLMAAAKLILTLLPTMVIMMKGANGHPRHAQKTTPASTQPGRSGLMARGRQQVPAGQFHRFQWGT